MNIRRITSLTAFLSFFFILLTSVVLYIVPQGRVAYWADWHLWGLSKDQWGAIHINVGFLFLLTLLLHIYYNWKPITLYLQNRSKQMKIFTKEFNIAGLITLLFIFGTYFEIPPFSTIIDIGLGIKDTAAKKYGEPPYGHAELSSLKTFAAKMGIDSKEGMDALRKAGYLVTSENQTLQELAHQNRISPQQLYQAMQPYTKQKAIFSENARKLPETPAMGTGNLTLIDFCHQYNLNVKTIIRALSEMNVSAEESMTIKKIAEKNQTSPTDLFEKIKSIVNK
ncbi:MAG: DUF4405 domain-containing protein [Deltaproteobacteria bacterium]|nr:MAG: DUF4405 domain-containing protein [Deltaproteobacteria bacterium]